MFDIFSWQHIVILLVVALVVVGPKDLPRLMHMAGKWAGKARDMANEFRKSFDEMARQAELDELRKEIEELKKNNPITDIANSVSDVQAEVNKPVEMEAAATEAAAEVLPEAGPEPRSGEFEVTSTAPASGPHTP
jgi:sec-independent protein translocase protein TatB